MRLVKELLNAGAEEMDFDLIKELSRRPDVPFHAIADDIPYEEAVRLLCIGLLNNTMSQQNPKSASRYPLCLSSETITDEDKAKI
ncbi:hypothetical protein MKZ38_009100 [Zalerion maritima]|uniref:Uncharacterized protein n=1 Tax=Zalerion maritima TaxID=339359 RepID=A0AAD5WTN3_9PEZI|nr:hypothetical protein MKZ38_009100 [Zalerion maritima]